MFETWKFEHGGDAIAKPLFKPPSGILGCSFVSWVVRKCSKSSHAEDGLKLEAHSSLLTHLADYRATDFIFKEANVASDKWWKIFSFSRRSIHRHRHHHHHVRQRRKIFRKCSKVNLIKMHQLISLSLFSNHFDNVCLAATTDACCWT